MARQHQAIIALQEEFSNHITNSSNRPFVPSKAGSAALSKLTRELEKKRQVGQLTPGESAWLRDVDSILENIARFNHQAANSAPLSFGSPTYSLPQKKLGQEEEHQKPLIIPRVSEEEANKIISHLNEQFEEKILKKAKQPDPLLDLEVRNPSDFDAGAHAEDAGRSLQDYLSIVREQLPETPFGDEDSSKDLSKVIANVPSRQKN